MLFYAISASLCVSFITVLGSDGSSFGGGCCGNGDAATTAGTGMWDCCWYRTVSRRGDSTNQNEFGSAGYILWVDETHPETSVTPHVTCRPNTPYMTLEEDMETLLLSLALLSLAFLSRPWLAVVSVVSVVSRSTMVVP
jgi:hypothetical protein